MTDRSAEIKRLEREAFSQYNADRMEEAQALLKEIIKLDPKHSLATFYLEKIQKKQPPTPKLSTTRRIPVEEETDSGSVDPNPTPLSTDRKPSAETIRYVASTKRMKRDEVFPPSDSGVHKSAHTTKRYKSSSIFGASGLPGDPPAKKALDTVKVMVVDDSTLMRKVIIRILEKSPTIKVVGEACNGEQALEMIPKLAPDVITMDVNMPIMDGVTALKHLIVSNALPVIMLSAYTEEGAVTTFDCLTYGSVDFICKPSREGGSLSGKEEEIIQKVIHASRLQVQPLRRARVGRREKDAELETRETASRVIVMGACEGGYGGFLKILPHIPEQLPAAILAVQYMEDKYFETFCSYLNQHSRIWVKKAQDAEPIKKGVCYMINQKDYLKIQPSTDGYLCQVAKKPDFLMQQNVFNHLLFSAAEAYGANTVGVVLSGKGIDGLEGIQELKRVRGITLAQDPRNCITPQLCEIAVNSGNIDRVVADADFPGVLWHLVKSPSQK